MQRYLWLVVLLLGLVGCGAGGLAFGAAPTPVSCLEQSESYLAQLEPLLDQWHDKSFLAFGTPRMALSPVIDDMQTLARDLEALEPPPCAAPVQEAVNGMTERTITGYLYAMANTPSDQAAAEGREWRAVLEARLELLKSGGDLNTSTSGGL